MTQQVLYETANGAILQWQDTAAFGYPAPAPGTAVLPVSAAQWSAQSGSFYVAGGLQAAGTAPAVTLTPAQQAQAALAAGVTVTSTGTPALDGTYPTSGPIWSDLKDEALFIASFGEFSSGAATISFALSPSSVVTFTAPAQLQAVVKAIGQYQTTLKTIIATGAGTLPSAGLTIA